MPEYCHAKNRDGTRCGRKVAMFPSGVFVRGPYCRQHARMKARTVDPTKKEIRQRAAAIRAANLRAMEESQ